MYTVKSHVKYISVEVMRMNSMLDLTVQTLSSFFVGDVFLYVLFYICFVLCINHINPLIYNNKTFKCFDQMITKLKPESDYNVYSIQISNSNAHQNVITDKERGSPIQIF